MKKLSLGIVFSIGLLGMVNGVSAQTAFSHSDFLAAKERADVEFNVAAQRCVALTDHSKDICVAESKANRTRIIEMAKAKEKNTLKSYQDAYIKIADAEYDLAKEKCSTLSGNEKDVCVKSAKSTHTNAVENAKATKKIEEVREDANKDKANAQYDVEVQRCKAFSGKENEDCIAKYKSLYGKN